MFVELSMNMQNKCIRYDLPILVNNTTKEILSKIDTHNLRSFAGYIKQYYMNLSTAQSLNVTIVIKIKN